MSNIRSPAKRDLTLRLAKQLADQYAARSAKPDAALNACQQVLHAVEGLRRLARHRERSRSFGWVRADLALAHRQAAALRGLQNLLNGLDRTPPQPKPVVEMPLIYRELQALGQEFEDLQIAEDLSTVSVVTDPIELEGIALGRFRLSFDLARVLAGRGPGSCLTADALDPNPASTNDEITHPHVQGAQVCLGDGAVPLQAALAEGRLYDAFVVVRQILMTYNDASAYVALDRWQGVTCDDCDDVVASDDTYSCENCGSSLCPSCAHVCADCQDSHCRSCLKSKDHDLLCSTCFDDREVREAESPDDDEDPKQDVEHEIQPLPLTPEETVHEQARIG